MRIIPRNPWSIHNRKNDLRSSTRYCSNVLKLAYYIYSETLSVVNDNRWFETQSVHSWRSLHGQLVSHHYKRHYNNHMQNYWSCTPDGNTIDQHQLNDSVCKYDFSTDLNGRFVKLYKTYFEKTHLFVCCITVHQHCSETIYHVAFSR